MKLILVRHSDCLKENQDLPLSSLGVSQAKCLAKRLSKLPITKVYVSDLKRATQTFEEYHKLTPDIPFEITGNLREIYRVLVGGEPKEGTLPTREPNDKQRVESFISRVKSMNENEIIVLITHGNFIRYVLSSFLETDPKRIGQHLYIAPASLSLVEISNKNSILVFVNDIKHLKGKLTSDSYFFYENTNGYLD